MKTYIVNMQYQDKKPMIALIDIISATIEKEKLGIKIN